MNYKQFNFIFFALISMPVIICTPAPTAAKQIAQLRGNNAPIPYFPPPNQQILGQNYYNQANNFLQTGNYQAAIENYTQALQISPSLAEAYLGRGLAKRRIGDNQGAIDDYTKVIQLQPNNALAYHNRGVVKAVLGKHQEALTDYTQALLINQNDATAYLNRGRSRFAIGDKLGAIKDYDMSLQRNQNNSLAWHYRGIAFFDLGNYQKALDSYNQAIQINQNWGNISAADAYKNRATTQLKFQNNQAASEDLEKAAGLYQQQGNIKEYQEAINALKNIQRL
ncbi:tetratricopeptide repeat protein [Ancylothrix sp. C2]|uniref:tetratricopeptide repeat protein n=1 Tax=Ancylothrix sp. D3o TaxID=2953691 RepID=UPI0021BADDA2|nr:tetratricopeptide repeat protein [Ancylothrix sp. D3o]MCT7948595.1 tetratricopeptide repeat protein [Ancylothrix sp. D3o]